MKLTNEQAIAHQLMVDNWEKPMVIPGTHSAGKVKVVEVDQREYEIQLYNFNYRKKGYARGIWLLVDLIKRNLKHCQLGVRLA